MKEAIYKRARQLLIDLINTPSLSKEEDDTALLIEGFFDEFSIPWQRQGNNVWALNREFDPTLPTILMNSHHDTVKPNKGYTRDPFKAGLEDGRIYGLGSNDAGGCLTMLMATFVHFYSQPEMPYNLVMLASAEEENSGEGGIRSVMPVLPEIDFAIIGEPTKMDLAIAEKGLLVLDCYAHGEAGHAAHRVGDMAIYKAMEAIRWFENYSPSKVSETLGTTKLTVTQINAGSQHNVVPAECHFVVDVRVNDCYTNQEMVDLIQSQVQVEVKPRSLRLNSSSIPGDHPIVLSGKSLGRSTYGSPTLSDQSNLSCPSLKLGPGDSLRSHSSDEFITEKELKEGFELYTAILGGILN